MSEFINTIDAIGDEQCIDAMIERSLTEYKDDVVTQIGAYGLAGYTELQTISLPNVTVIGTGAFSDCTSLTLVDCPRLTYTETGSEGPCFEGCTSLVEISLPSFSGTVRPAFFNNCKSLEFVDLWYCTGLYYRSFSGCSNLKTVVLRNETLVPNNGTNTFGNSTNIAVYVPTALIESYQTATNWSTLYANGTCVFKALEDYTVDGTTTGVLDKTKI